MSYYIIIRGPLGSGKSTISEKLARMLDAKHIGMDEVLEKHGLDKISPEAPCISVENFMKANEILLPEVEKLLSGGKIIIFDACFYHKEVIEHLVQSLPFSHYIFTLKAPLELCVKRDSARQKPHGESAAEAVYSLVSRFDYGNIIDVTGNLENTLKDIFSYLPTRKVASLNTGIRFASMSLKQFINNTKKSIATHWIGLILSFCIGAVIAAPPIIFRFSDGYKGVDMLKTNTEIHYLAQIQEVYDGDRLITNPFFKGLKDTPYLFPPLSPNIVATFGQIFSLSPVETVMITRFIIASLLAFLIYLFAATVAKNKLVGWVAALFVLLGYSLLDPGYLLGLLTGELRLAELTFIDYGRPINPQLSSLFFFGYLLSFWHLLHQRERVWRYGVICAFLLGASFYVYLFTWTFIYSLNGFLFFIYAGKRDWTKVKRIILVSVGAGLIGIPYLLNVWQAAHHPWYEESAVRFGFVKSRFLSVSRLAVAVLILFLAVYKKLNKQTRLFFAGFFLTAFFVVNEQMVTGRYVFNHHYHWYYITPLLIVLLVLILFSVLSWYVKRRAVTYLVAALLAAFIFYNGITVQAASYSFILPQVADEQRYAPVLAWLNQATKKEEAVLASYTLARMIPALTHNNVYYHGTGIYSLVSDEQLLHAYLVYLYLNGVPQAGVSEYLRDNQSELTAFVYGYKHAFQPGVCGDCVSDTIRTRLASEYQTLSDAAFLSYLKQYPIDYIIWDKKENPDWNLDKFGLKKVQEFGSLIVYDVR